jgi:hypothetical protein
MARDDNSDLYRDQDTNLEDDMDMDNRQDQTDLTADDESM